MTTPAVTPVNNTNTINTLNNTPQESIWSKEVNPGVPTGHADSNLNEADTFNHSENQDPAAINISPEVKQAAKESAVKAKTLIIAAGAAVVAALVAIRNKTLPEIKQAISKFIPIYNNYMKNRTPILNATELTEYLKSIKTTINPPFRRIKIYTDNLGTTESITNVVNDLKKVADDFVTSEKTKGKRPVFHMILNPEHANRADEIVKMCNEKNKIEIIDNGTDITKEVIQRVEMLLEPVSKIHEKLFGPHPALISVGPPRTIPKEATILDLLIGYVSRSKPIKIVK